MAKIDVNKLFSNKLKIFTLLGMYDHTLQKWRPFPTFIPVWAPFPTFISEQAPLKRAVSIGVIH